MPSALAKMSPTESAALSPRSKFALDWTNVLLADVRDGVGPFLGIFLIASRGWSKTDVGIAAAVCTLATVIAQTPAGAIVDRFARRREMVAAASLIIGAMCVAMTFFTARPFIFAAQAIIGGASTVVGPAVAAISLGLVGRRGFDRRIGRNEAYNHGGNVIAALAAGLLGTFVAPQWAFWIVGGFAIAGSLAVMLIRGEEIDARLARGADADDDAGKSSDGEASSDADKPATRSWREFAKLFADRRVLAFSIAVVLFHFANAYMLPLAGQRLAATLGEESRGAFLYMSACIIVAQIVMVPVGLLSARTACRFGRRWTFFIAFAVLPIRGVLYTLTDSPAMLIAIQALDGVGAGIFGVVSVLIISDLTRGTGRFNLFQGAVGTATGIGASLSAILTGRISDAHGFDAGFLFLAAVAAVAVVIFAIAVPETLNTNNDGTTQRAGDDRSVAAESTRDSAFASSNRPTK